MKNDNVARDLRIFGKLWGDIDGDHELEANVDNLQVAKTGDNFTPVLSRSQKRKQRQARRLVQKASQYNTRYGSGSESVSLDF